MTTFHDVIVVGGGPAGAASAAHLARLGRKPILLEREMGPRHKVCGDFLSVEAAASLRELGVDLEGLGAAAIRELRVIHGHATAAAPLPFVGLGLTRQVLDEEMLRLAATWGAQVMRGVTVRGLTVNGNEQSLALAGGRDLRSRSVLLATGKHDLRSVTRKGSRGLDDYIGFKNYFTLDHRQRQALDGAVELILFSGGYAGLQMVENGAANLCILVKRSTYENLGRTWFGLLAGLCRECSHLAQRLEGSSQALPKPISISGIPYGFIHRRHDGNDGLYRVGDQAVVIPSLTGDGVAIALHSAKLAAYMHAEMGNSAGLFHRRLSGDVGQQVRTATLLQQIGQTNIGRKLLLRVGQICPVALQAAAACTRLSKSALHRG
jgi:flavin-dependent dehydrogenase